jgi:hypothetical protein
MNSELRLPPSERGRWRTVYYKGASDAEYPEEAPARR